MSAQDFATRFASPPLVTEIKRDVNDFQRFSGNRKIPVVGGPGWTQDKESVIGEIEAGLELVTVEIAHVKVVEEMQIPAHNL